MTSRLSDSNNEIVHRLSRRFSAKRINGSVVGAKPDQAVWLVGLFFVSRQGLVLLTCRGKKEGRVSETSVTKTTIKVPENLSSSAAFARIVKLLAPQDSTEKNRGVV